MLKLYVGCGLTHAPEDFQQKVVELKERLRSIPSVSVLEFLGVTNGTAHDVYVHDIIDGVGECDIMIAICDHASTGLGWEMATQVGRGKPLLAFGHQDSKITRLVLDPGLSNYFFFRYDDFEEVFRIVEKIVREVWAA